ncbi:MAG TPA: hypothetical protein VK434_02475 [Microvirga sp.]|jgi:hypothetical protein|nr:hypothetical protein [Microvirga sp.]
MPTQHDALAVTLAVVLALAVALLAAVAGAGVFEPRPRAQGAAPDPNCAEWSDGCVICLGAPTGPACSTPGIACTRGPMQCVRRR